MAERFFIGPLVGGTQRNLKPWMISDQAYETLRNCYEWRGRIRKRFGTQPTSGPSEAIRLSRTRISIGTTDGAGNLGPVNLPLNTGDMKVGQMFSIDTDCYTIIALGNLATVIQTGAAVVMVDTTASPATAEVFGGPANTEVFFYPLLPIVGIWQYQSLTTNFESTVVFDTRFAYTFNGTGWSRLGTAEWSGNDTNFIWASNYIGAARDDYLLFTVNYNAADGIFYYDGTNWNVATYQPETDSGSGNFILSARIVIPFKDRLLLLNVIETNGIFTQRCRYSQNGDPTSADAWYESGSADKGGYIDAPTREAIQSAAILRDRLIVYFERSTWELVYTGNQVVPFVWQVIDKELGAESPFSIVTMDKFIFGVGDIGIHACNGTGVERIDSNIPDEVFEIKNLNDGPLRVAGIRDYINEMIYWAIPVASFSTNNYPRQIISYNYKTGTFAFFDDTFTTFGYFQPTTSLTWATLPQPWQSTYFSWDSAYVNAGTLRILAGNQQGFLQILNNELALNAPSLSITNISIASPPAITFTVDNHNLDVGDYIYFTGIEGTGTMSNINDEVYRISSVTTNTLTIIWDSGTFPTGSYQGCGVISRISDIEIITKQYNFFNKEGRNISIDQVDFNVLATAYGELTVDALPSFSEVSTLDNGLLTGAAVGDNVLETFPNSTTIFPMEANQSQLWHTVYLQGEGDVVQLRLYQTDFQIRLYDLVTEPFELHGVMYTGRRTASQFR